MLEQASLTRFKASLAGDLVQPGDEGYDEARKVYDAMIDRRPRLIVRCADVADVIAAVNFGRQNNMLLAIRSGVTTRAVLAYVTMVSSSTFR
jgi:hypothetical protein